MSVHVQVGGSLLEVSGISAQVGGSLLPVSEGWVQTASGLLQFYPGSSTFSATIIPATSGDLVGYRSTGLGSITSNVMSGGKTLTDFYDSNGVLPADEFFLIGIAAASDPGESFLVSATINFPSVTTRTVGGANYSVSAWNGSKRTWKWSLQMALFSGQNTAITVRHL